MVDVWRGVEQRGWQVEIRPLRAPEAGLQACLLPSAEYEFVIWVDDRPSPSEEEDPSAPDRGPNSPLVRFRLAHELAHSLFYRSGRPPTRRTRPDALEEDFCDQVAALILVDETEANRATCRGEKSVVAFARAWRSPVAAVRVAVQLGSKESSIFASDAPVLGAAGVR